MNDLVKLYARPRLKSPVMLAAWPGVGSVSILVAQYLLRKLEFKRLGEIQASHFFDPVGIVVENNIVEAPQFPQSRFYYWKNSGEGNDVILFIGDDQPAAKSYELAECVIDMGRRFKVSRVYTCAAALTRIHHTEQPQVWGAVTSQHLTAELARYDLAQRGNLHIAGLNGILLGVAKESNVEGICLLGEVPMYATRMQNPMAALAVLRVLAHILKIKVDMTEFQQIAAEAREKMKQIAAEAMGEYIDFFTEPIWEQDDEDEDDEE